MIRERLVQVVSKVAPTPVAWLTLIMGLFVHWVAFFVITLKVPEFRIQEPDESFVRYLDMSEPAVAQFVYEASLLADSRSLFLPTPLNYAWGQLDSRKYLDQQPLQLLEPVEMALVIEPDQILDQPFEGVAAIQATDLLDKAHWNYFDTLSMSDRQVPTLTSRFASLEVRDKQTGQLILSNVLDERDAQFPEGVEFWRPVSFVVIANEIGMFGEPLLIRTSGQPPVDQFARNYIQQLAKRWVFKRGYYEVIFGP